MEVGIPAFLGRIHGETRCAFWVDEPVAHDFDPELLIDIDLAHTPEAAGTSRRIRRHPSYAARHSPPKPFSDSAVALR